MLPLLTGPTAPLHASTDHPATLVGYGVAILLGLVMIGYGLWAIARARRQERPAETTHAEGGRQDRP